MQLCKYCKKNNPKHWNYVIGLSLSIAFNVNRTEHYGTYNYFFLLSYSKKKIFMHLLSYCALSVKNCFCMNFPFLSKTKTTN